MSDREVQLSGTLRECLYGDDDQIGDNSPVEQASLKCDKIVQRKPLSLKVRDVIKAIEEAGWVHRDTTGDHRNYKKPGERYIITVPGKPSDDVSPGVISDMRRKTGLPLR